MVKVRGEGVNKVNVVDRVSFITIMIQHVLYIGRYT